jgi:hypothetical protein
MSLRAYVHHDAKSRAYARLGLRAKAARHGLLASRLAFGASPTIGPRDCDTDTTSPDDGSDSDLEVISPARADRERAERAAARAAPRMRPDDESDEQLRHGPARGAARRDRDGQRRPRVLSDDDEPPPLVSDDDEPGDETSGRQAPVGWNVAIRPGVSRLVDADDDVPATRGARRPGYREYRDLFRRNGGP